MGRVDESRKGGFKGFIVFEFLDSSGDFFDGRFRCAKHKVCVNGIK